MSTGHDDDALSWDGDDDPTLVHRDRPPRLPKGYTAVGRGSDAVADADGAAGTRGASDGGDPGDAHAPQGNVALIAYGVLGGVYLLFAVGWLVGGLRLHGVADLLVTGGGAAAPPLWAAGNAAALALAVAAPLIWFAGIVHLTRRSAAWLRWVLLGAGAVLFVPWPFVMMGAIGS